MQRIKSQRPEAGYDNSLLLDFYLPIFESKFVHRLYFLSDWESSVGAKWEHDQAVRLGIPVEYLSLT